ncbi:MAG: hypothetical protein R2795_01910 [Saprospiraceae bacterium]
MRNVLLVNGGRKTPLALTAYAARSGVALVSCDGLVGSLDAFGEIDAVVILSPAWAGGTYVNTLDSWERLLVTHHPNIHLIVASFQEQEHSNHLDLLRLDEYGEDWWEETQPIASMRPFAAFDGMDLSKKLHRFFAGHGQESITAVMSRIRMVVQMASRELLKSQTPYEEIYAELVAPAKLSEKWEEWNNRWVNYYPLFAHTPLAAPLERVAAATDSIAGWMLQGGTDAEALKTGDIQHTLDAIRTMLQDIEKQYVVQKLSLAHC